MVGNQRSSRLMTILLDFEFEIQEELEREGEWVANYLGAGGN